MWEILHSTFLQSLICFFFLCAISWKPQRYLAVGSLVFGLSFCLFIFHFSFCIHCALSNQTLIRRRGWVVELSRCLASDTGALSVCALHNVIFWSFYFYLHIHNAKEAGKTVFCLNLSLTYICVFCSSFAILSLGLFQEYEMNPTLPFT